ncbi:hypothetical protein E1193_24530 [Micromonospora sp. KC606]|nr:hypothetical protein E1193_24530 [Micromonospora sp. KC606]
MSALQRTQLSVQALTRLASVSVFLLASWRDTAHLPLVALQGALFALPFALMEALVGRPLAAGLVPGNWDLGRWARSVATACVLPVGVVGYLSATVALPQTGVADRLLMITPVLLQLPIEALFWATTRSGSLRRANLLPQLTAVGTVIGAVAFVAVGLRVDVAAVPTQVGVLAWAVLRLPPARRDQVSPGLRPGLSVGSVYCFATVIDLSYSIALPSVAGAVAGQATVVVLRAMDLAFGPFHVLLSASTREDVVAGRRSPRWTAVRGLTVAALLAVSAAMVLGGARVRGLLAADLAAVGVTVVALYCAYKALLMVSTWLSIRHMIRAVPRRYLVSAVGSRVVAFAVLAVVVVQASRPGDLVLLLVVGEVLVVVWFLARMRSGGRADDTVAVVPGGGEAVRL